MAERKSPISGNPYRVPGGTLRSMVIAQRDRVLDTVLVAALWSGLIAGAWLGSQNENTFRTFLFIGAAVFPICGWLFYKRLYRFRRLKQGLEGEQSVGLFLERLRANGALLLHDFPRGKANIDHIVIHPSGVYAVETKTWSYRSENTREIVFNGKGVSVGGGRFYEDSVNQAKSQAAHLSGVIKELTGKALFVQPVLLFPGWTIRMTTEASSEQILVMEPKRFVQLIQSRPTVGGLSTQPLWAALSARARA